MTNGSTGTEDRARERTDALIAEVEARLARIRLAIDELGLEVPALIAKFDQLEILAYILGYPGAPDIRSAIGERLHARLGGLFGEATTGGQ